MEHKHTGPRSDARACCFYNQTLPFVVSNEVEESSTEETAKN